MNPIKEAELYRQLVQHFPFTPTHCQTLFMQRFAAFMAREAQDGMFVLRGYAGTGKTSLMMALTEVLPKQNRPVVLLAPTGRAAKVMSSYTSKQAQTIHRRIYFTRKDKAGGMAFTLQPNKFKNTLFIVDEASMIADQPTDAKSGSGSTLLDDLIIFVYSGSGCQLLFLGDTAQLPPVHATFSPALHADYLRKNFSMEVVEVELNEVMRQAEDSGILANATELRQAFQDDFWDAFTFQCDHFPDIYRMTDAFDIQDAIQHAYSEYGPSDTCFIVRSNKRANQYNQQIRTRILSRESQLSVGDLVMVVKNNYFWLDDTSEAGFIANGDVLEVLRIEKYSELYGFHFAHVQVQMIDYPAQKPFETVLLLDTLTSESPSLTYGESNRLYQEVLQDYADEKSGYKRLQKIKGNPYFNALQIKFSYAVTCHKAQGGQWPIVFIEQPYLPNGPDTDFIRWLYTALTRAQQKVYLLGFQDRFFD